MPKPTAVELLPEARRPDTIIVAQFPNTQWQRWRYNQLTGRVRYPDGKGARVVTVRVKNGWDAGVLREQLEHLLPDDLL